MALRLRAALAALASVAWVSAASCTSPARANDFIRRSCTLVAAGIAAYAKESPSQSAAANAALQHTAIDDLVHALPYAAQAAENSSQWNGLMTNLQEINRVSITLLVPVLGEQCGAVLGHPIVPTSAAGVPTPAAGGGAG